MHKLRTALRRRAVPFGSSPTGQIKPTKVIKRAIQRTKVKMSNTKATNAEREKQQLAEQLGWQTTLRHGTIFLTVVL
jgi:hypothetical protein